ncbi:Cyclin N-terminal domain-containing protein [Mycena venus]|uniref:Cyclin N-terminal domain-containing protein n=1 Tax=Mycena venus TaxID=2733690 RepID=A0A8H6XHN3_9AGAR|nr:Cyclin N-terminal domain-containing protein [Mycena venus]
MDCISGAVEYAFGKTAHSPCSLYHKKISTFVANILSRAEVAPATVLVSLVYIARARTPLHSARGVGLPACLPRRFKIHAGFDPQECALGAVYRHLLSASSSRRSIGIWELNMPKSDLLAHYEALVAAVSGVRFEARLQVKFVPAKAEVEEMDMQQLAISLPDSLHSRARDFLDAQDRNTCSGVKWILSMNDRKRIGNISCKVKPKVISSGVTQSVHDKLTASLVRSSTPIYGLLQHMDPFNIVSRVKDSGDIARLAQTDQTIAIHILLILQATETSLPSHSQPTPPHAADSKHSSQTPRFPHRVRSSGLIFNLDGVGFTEDQRNFIWIVILDYDNLRGRTLLST